MGRMGGLALLAPSPRPPLPHLRHAALRVKLVGQSPQPPQEHLARRPHVQHRAAEVVERAWEGKGELRVLGVRFQCLGGRSVPGRVVERAWEGRRVDLGCLSQCVLLTLTEAWGLKGVQGFPVPGQARGGASAPRPAPRW